MKFESIKEFEIERKDLAKIQGGRNTAYPTGYVTQSTTGTSPRYDNTADSITDYKSGDPGEQ